MNNTMELLEKTKHAKYLILRGACIEVLSEGVVRGWRLPHSSRRNLLVLVTWRDEDSIPGLLGLLESSPNLEKFLVECCDSYEVWNKLGKHNQINELALTDIKRPYGQPLSLLRSQLSKTLYQVNKLPCHSKILFKK